MMTPPAWCLARAVAPHQSPAMLKFASILLFVSTLAAGPALAGQASPWHNTEGGSIRVVTEAEPGPDGKLRGALQIVLEPGWKTYWADPGDWGVPPSVSVEDNPNVSSPEIGFPPPKLQDDGYSQFAGYDAPVALALTFPIDDPDGAIHFTADVFLGVCQSICIPVRASLTVASSSAADPSARIVADAFADLPAPASESFGANAIEVRDGRLIVEAQLPDGAGGVALFVVSTDSHMLGKAERIASDGDRIVFAVPLMEVGPAVGSLRTGYTLVTDRGSVSGMLTIGE